MRPETRVVFGPSTPVGFGSSSRDSTRRPSLGKDVSGNWRVVFRFDGNDAVDVDYLDYH